MNLPLVQLQAVLLIIMMLFGINLASAAPSDSDIAEAKEKLDGDLKPYINPQIGYLHLMPVFTLRSVLVSFIHVEKNEPDLEETSRIFHFNGDICTGFRSLETASQLLQHLKQLRPFNGPPYTELTGSILMEIFSKLTSTVDQMDNRLRNNMTRNFSKSNDPCITQWSNYMDVKRSSEHYEVTWKNLVRYPLAEWYQYQKKDEQHSFWTGLFKSKHRNEAEVPNELGCYEAALLWTVYHKIKAIYEYALHDLKVFKKSLDHFLLCFNDDKTPRMLLVFTIRFGIHHQLINQTGNGELHEQFLADSGEVKPQIALFNQFLYQLGLIPKLLDHQELMLLNDKANFQDLEITLNTKDDLGWEYFEMLQKLEYVDKSPFITIFEGFRQYQDDMSLVDNDVFKNYQVIHFIVSYGNMFKLKDLKMAPPPTTILPAAVPPIRPQPMPLTDSPTELPEDPQIWPLSDSSTVPPTTTSASVQPKVSGSGCWNQTQSCLSSLPWWSKVIVGLVALAIIFNRHLIWFALSGNATTAPTTANPLSESTTSAGLTLWMVVIIVLFVVVLLAIGGHASWWWLRRRARRKKKGNSETTSSDETTKSTKVVVKMKQKKMRQKIRQKLRQKRKRSKASPMMSSPRVTSAVSSAATPKALSVATQSSPSSVVPSVISLQSSILSQANTATSLLWSTKCPPQLGKKGATSTSSSPQAKIMVSKIKATPKQRPAVLKKQKQPKVLVSKTPKQVKYKSALF